MRIAPDPFMQRHLSLEELPFKVKDLGYDWIELSPRGDFLEWFKAPCVFPERVRSFRRTPKAVVDGRSHGAPLMFHSRHRNAAVPEGLYTSDMLLNDTLVHDADIARWLRADEVTAVELRVPRRSSRGKDLRDPVLVLLHMGSGAIVDVEISDNIACGYDIRGEVGCEMASRACRTDPRRSSPMAKASAKQSLRTGVSASLRPMTRSSANGSTRPGKGRPPAPPPGTAMPRRWSRTRRCVQPTVAPASA